MADHFRRGSRRYLILRCLLHVLIPRPYEEKTSFSGGFFVATQKVLDYNASIKTREDHTNGYCSTSLHRCCAEQ